MHNIEKRLIEVRKRIHSAAMACGRSTGDIRLLAVSKTRPAADLRVAYSAGQRSFGENYLQEALSKQEELGDLPIEWHFIGPIQSNKTRAIASNFQWVHSVDRLRVASRLSAQRPEGLPPLNVCLQVNLDNESSKSGVALDAIEALLDSVATLPNIRARGLMSIPAPRVGFEAQRQALSPLLTAMQKLRERHPQLDTLSMGMSADLEAAVAAGSTLLRIGTDIFGERP